MQDPVIDRGVIDVQTSLPHHLFKISVAERIPKIPTDAEQNDLGFVMTPFERGRMVHEARSSQSTEYAPVYRIDLIFATQPLGVSFCLLIRYTCRYGVDVS